MPRSKARDQLLIADSGPLIALVGIEHLNGRGPGARQARRSRAMRAHGYYLSDAVIEYALRQVGEASDGP